MKFSKISYLLLFLSIILFIQCNGNSQTVLEHSVHSEYQDALKAIPKKFQILFGFNVSALKEITSIEDILPSLDFPVEENETQAQQTENESNQPNEYEEFKETIGKALLSFSQNTGFNIATDVEYIIGGMDPNTGETMLVFNGRFDKDQIQSNFLQGESRQQIDSAISDLPNEWIEIKINEYLGVPIFQKWHFKDNTELSQQQIEEYNNMLNNFPQQETQTNTSELPPGMDDELLNQYGFEDTELQFVFRLISNPHFRLIMKEGMMNDPTLQNEFSEADLQAAITDETGLNRLLFLLVAEQLKNADINQIQQMIEFFENDANFQ